VKQERAWNDKCGADPLYWLTHHTKTRDDHWREKGTEPYARFPDKPYFPWLFEGFRTERRLFVPKSRDMMVSWAVMGYLTWLAQWYGPCHILVQTQREDKAKDFGKRERCPWLRADPLRATR
jgi:hypothetical protein